LVFVSAGCGGVLPAARVLLIGKDVAMAAI
jgi:hypothetical protein